MFPCCLKNWIQEYNFHACSLTRIFETLLQCALYSTAQHIEKLGFRTKLLQKKIASNVSSDYRSGSTCFNGMLHWLYYVVDLMVLLNWFKNIDYMKCTVGSGVVYMRFFVLLELPETPAINVEVKLNSALILFACANQNLFGPRLKSDQRNKTED